MLVQRISRTDPERVFIVVRNDQGGTVTRGYPLAFNMDGTRNGVDVQLVDTVADEALLAGIAHTDIADQDYGLAQAYGYDDDAVLVKTNSNLEIGGVLACLSASSCLQVISTAQADKVIYAGFASGAEQMTSSSAVTTRAKIFIRLL